MENSVKRKAGRPEGALSKLSRDARERAMSTGMMPHEILLSIARGEIQTTQQLDKDSGEIQTTKVSVDMSMRVDAAKAAAPYYAPKLSTVELMKTGSDDELDSIIKELAAQAGVDLGAAGESQTGDSEDGTEEQDGDGVVEPTTRSRRRANFS